MVRDVIKKECWREASELRGKGDLAEESVIEEDAVHDLNKRKEIACIEIGEAAAQVR